MTNDVVFRGSCELVWVEGEDAESFLQGLLTNDVAALDVGATCPALVLDNSGHVRGAMRCHRDGPDAFTLITSTGHGARLTELLDEYHFSETVEIIGPEPSDVVTFLDGAVPPGLPGADLVVPGLVPGTTDAIVADADAIVVASGRVAAPADVWERRRVEAGVPLYGVDYTAANLVQEAGLEHDHVSFDKGCYLGQETVARIHYRGQVNRRLVGVLLDGPVAPGAGVRSAGKAVGTITSAAPTDGGGSIGLGILRREVAAGDAVEVDGLTRPAVVVDLPFTNSEQPASKNRAHRAS